MTAFAARSRGDGSGARPVGEALAFWLPAAMAAGYAAWFWSNPIGGGAWSPFGDNPMHGDSKFLIDFNRYRTAGYPVFLDAVAAVFGSADAAPKVQLVLTAASVWFLAWSAARAAAAPRLAPALALALFAASSAARFHAYILTEALFVPLLCVMAGFLALAAARPALGAAFAAALACGLAIAARPAGLGLLAVWPALLWFAWGRLAGRRLRFAAAIAAPLAACALAEAAAWRAAHPAPVERPNVAGRMLFAKAHTTEARTPPRLAADADAAAFLADARAAAAPARALAAAAPDWRTRAFALEYAESRFFIAFYRDPFLPRAAALAARRGTTVDGFLGAAALAALLAAPGEWARNAWTHYRALWTHHSIYGAEFLRRRGAWLARIDDLRARGGETSAPARRGPQPEWLAAANRAATAASFLASIAVLAAAALRRSRGPGPGAALAAAALCALAVHGYFALSAAVNHVHMRYSAAMWPLQVTYCALPVWLAVRAISERAARRRSPCRRRALRRDRIRRACPERVDG